MGDNTEQELIDLSVDDMLSDLGVVNPMAPLSPEEEFYNSLTGTTEKYQKIYNLRYWLNYEMSIVSAMRERGFVYTKDAASGKGIIKKELTLNEIGREFVEYFLLMNYLPRFRRTDGRTACDMNKVLDMILMHDEIKRTIHKKFD